MSPLPEDHKAVRARIEGRVQGVYFRDWTQKTAMSMGLYGWVRNRKDGSVEALVVGPATAVDAMCQQFHNGPERAAVTNVVLEEGRGMVPNDEFRIKPTV